MLMDINDGLIYITKGGEFKLDSIKNAKEKGFDFLLFNDVVYKIKDDELILVGSKTENQHHCKVLNNNITYTFRKGEMTVLHFCMNGDVIINEKLINDDKEFLDEMSKLILNKNNVE